MILLKRCTHHVLPLVALCMLSYDCEALPLNPNTQALQPKLNTVTHVYTFKQLGWDNATTLNGYEPNYTFYLPIDTHLNLKKAVLNLKMTFSPFLNQETSSVEVKFNQNFIRRLSAAADSNQEMSWEIELPLTQLSRDWQDLTFSAYLTSKNSLCSPNVWVYISPESSITLTGLEVPFHGSLEQLPYPFVDPGLVDPLPVLMLLPKHFTQDEVFSLFQVAWQLGQLAGDSKINLSVDLMGDALAQQKDHHLIVIGTSKHLLQDGITPLIQTDEINKALTKHAGVILLNPSPYDPFFGLLTLTGDNNEALLKAVDAFLTPEFKFLASGQMAIVEQIQTDKATAPSSDEYLSSFKELGYSDQSISGLGRHKLTYYIPLPNDRIPTSAQIKTFITVPTFRDNHHSQITLLINGLKQTNFWLNQEHSEWKIDIGSEALKPGLNRLDYLIDLHLNHEQCTREAYNEVWASIYSKTEFQASFNSSFPISMLNELPVPFESEITVILSEQLSKQDLNHLAKLFFKFGQLTQTNPVHFNFRTISQVDESFVRNNNIILVGTPQSNSWVKWALKDMPMQLHGQSRFLKLPRETLEFSGNPSTGLLELMPSPWSEGHAVLLISGDDDPALSRAIAALTNDKKRIALNGNIALINPNQSTTTINSYDNRYMGLKQRASLYFSHIQNNLLFYIQTHPQVFIYLLVLVVPLIILLRKRKK